MPIDYSGVITWMRDALRETEDTLPDDELQLISKSSVRRLLGRYPIIVENGGVDLVDLSEEDRDIFDEAAGLLAAARWIVRPRPEGEEVVIRSKIAQLEETYQVSNVEELMQHFMEDFQSTIGLISSIAHERKQNALTGKGAPKIVAVSPSRYRATLEPNKAGALASLFYGRDEESLGPDFPSANF